jgi:hypothetical protein
MESLANLEAMSVQANTSLELTPTVGPLKWSVWGAGIESMIGSAGERSSAPSRWAAKVGAGPPR